MKYLLFCLMILPYLLLAQVPGEQQIRARYDSLALKSYHEICYLQGAQGIHLSGEPMAIGIHVLDKMFHLPSSLSKVVYVELLGQGNVVLLRQKCVISNGLGKTMLNIPKDAPSGQYLLRGYTRWMRNDGESSFFQQWVKIVNPESVPAASPATELQGPFSLRYRPEGGAWMASAPTPVVLQLRAADGSPVAASCTLFADQDSLSSCELSPAGLGQIAYTFVPNTSYRLQFSVNGAVIHEQELQPEVAKAASLHLAPPVVGQNLEVEIRHTTAASWFLVEHRGRIAHLQAMAGQTNALSIPASKLMPGVQRISVWNKFGELLAERFCYVPDADPLSLSVEPVNAVAQFREELVMNVSASHLPAAAFPIQMTAICSQQGIRAGGISDALMLWADLPNPALMSGYSLAELDAGELHLLLALQQSEDPSQRQWTAPAWSGFAAESAGLLLQGRITDKAGNGMPEQDILLAVPGSVPFLRRASSDATGTFAFILEPEIGQPREVIVRGPAEMPADWNLSLASSFADAPTMANWPGLWLDPKEMQWLETRYQSQQLQGRFAPEDGAAQILPPAYASVIGPPTAQFRFADYTPMPTEETFREYILQASLRKKEGIQEIILSNGQGEGLFWEPPLLLIDGVPVYNSSEIIGMHHRLVDRVEIMNKSWHLNGKTYSGVFHMITRAADFSNGSLRDNDLRVALQLFQSELAPADSAIASARFPDLNNLLQFETLLWQSPETLHIQLPTSDEAGNYLLTLEGITATGMPIRATTVLTVSR
ncbi:MAG: hypothetical protein NWR72_03490 [Bacteroidia bacterium]|nr:hypothetical protein [Bacteroidia bacterium]